MDRRPEKTFLQRGNTDDQQTREKRFNTAAPQGNANPATARHRLTLPGGYIQRKQMIKCWQGCGEKGILAYC